MGDFIDDCEVCARRGMLHVQYLHTLKEQTMDVIDWEPMPKIPRWSKGGVIISEKIDGTNASVIVSNDGTKVYAAKRTSVMHQGDNFGFRAWVEANASELVKLGPGVHFGEWYGAGIQRGYGLTEKRFALFNSFRWAENRPACCGVVPVLAKTSMMEAPAAIAMAMERLSKEGSLMVPGWMKPEGIVIFSEASGTYFKMTFDGDGHKGEVKEVA